MFGRRLLSLIAASALVVGAFATPAGAQSAPSGASIRIVSQPVWRAPGDRLDIKLRIRNDGPDPVPGYILTVTAHSRVLSRSELHQSFEEPPAFAASSITAVTAPRQTIDPGSSVAVTIDDPIASLQSLAAATAGGVYPLTLSLFDSARTQVLATVTTPLIYYPSPPETPLNIVPVIPINAPSSRGPDGRFEVVPGTNASPLETALREGGWLSGLVATLDEVTEAPPPPQPPPRKKKGRAPRHRPSPGGPEPLHLGLAITPRTLEEVADLAGGFRRSTEGETVEVKASDSSPASARRVLTELREVAGRDTVQPILVPYAYPDLPTVESTIPDHIKQQLNEGEAVLSADLNSPPGRSWFLPPGGRLDLDTLNDLESENTGRHTFITDKALDHAGEEGLGCPEATLSATCPISIETGSARTSGYILDSELQILANSLSTADDPRLALQQLFAETAMIREELPSRGDRIISLVLPGLWAPDPALARALLDGLRDAPWLAGKTPKEGLNAFLKLKAEPQQRRILSHLPDPLGRPDVSLTSTITDAKAALETFGSLQPPAALLERLTRNVLVSESRAWWGDDTLQEQGESYALDSADEAERELGKITIGENPSEVRLTSRQAQVPVVVFNEATYPVSVAIHLESPQLQISETFPETIQAHSLRQLNVDVTVPAQSSGIFPLRVTVQTPEGVTIADRDDITIRSTEFNEIALGITFGALAFLIFFYVIRTIRRRRGAGEPAQA